MCVCVCVCTHAQSCPTLCHPMDCSVPGFSVHSVLTLWKDWCWSWRSNTLATWFEELTPLLGMIEGKRRRGWQKMRWLHSITDPVDMNLSKLQDLGEDRGVWCATVCGVAKSQTRLSNWPTNKEGDIFLMPMYKLLFSSGTENKLKRMKKNGN